MMKPFDEGMVISLKKLTFAIFLAALISVGGFFAYKAISDFDSDNTGTTISGISSDNAGTAVSLSADYPHYDSIADLTAAASDIISGSIIDTRTELINISMETNGENEFANPGGEVQDGYLPYTVFTLEVNETYKGGYTAGDRIEIKRLGEKPELNLNGADDYVFFLESYELVPASLLNPSQSVYVFNAESDLTDGILESVSKSNDLTLTYLDLQNINDAPTAEITSEVSGKDGVYRVADSSAT